MNLEKTKLTACVSWFILLGMGTLSFVRRHSTLAVFTASLTTSAFFVACGDDGESPQPPTEAGTGGSGGGSSGAGGGGSAGKASGGSAGKGGSGGGTAGAGGKAAGGTGGGTAGAGGGDIPDAKPDVISSNGDAASDGDVPDGN